MKMQMAIVSLFLAANTWAGLTQCDQIPIVVHINGITTPKGDAISSQKMLERALAEKLGHKVPTDLAYNQTHGFFADIAQTFYQLSQQNPDTAPEKIAEALLYGNAPEGMDQRIAEGAIRYYQAKAEQAALAQLTLDEESEILRDIRSASAKAEKVLLVPHSQGNLFANRMYTLLTDSGALQPQDLRIHGAASPADRVLGGGSYLTSRNDVVIASLDILRKVLPHNIEIPRTQSDLLGHGFKEVYLNPALNGRQAMVDGMVAAMEEMNTSSYPPFASDPLLRRAPLVLGYYNLADDSTIGSDVAATGSIHLVGPNQQLVRPGRNFNDFSPLISARRNLDLGKGQYQNVYAITCDADPALGGAHLLVGTYEVAGDYVAALGALPAKIQEGVGTGFVVQRNWRHYDYQFLESSQRRSFDDFAGSKIEDNYGGSFYVGGLVNLVLGKLIVTQDESTGRFEITWHPTPELAATEVKQP
ncbi:hypothetical protein [Chitiniphilus shinanonensis]|uniref:hypothetical protein n=1 Tax=Chitiniphilus shinanonensis TaxID=553088 RepID=UPI003341F828